MFCNDKFLCMIMNPSVLFCGLADERKLDSLVQGGYVLDEWYKIGHKTEN